MLPMTVWTDTTIDGRKCASTTVRNKRLYVCERFGQVEAWIDDVRIGSYVDLYDAKVAVLKIRGPSENLQTHGVRRLPL
jgi:hypothetical protein